MIWLAWGTWAAAGPLADARAAEENADWDAAGAAYQRAAEANGESGPAWAGLGRARYNQGRFADSAAAYARAAQLGYDVPLGRYNEACSRALAGEPDGALAAFGSAMAAGFADVAHVDADPDLDSIRARPEFEEALVPLRSVALLSLATQHGGTWVPWAQVSAKATALCAARSPSACALVGLATPDRAAMVAALDPVCAGGDGPACVGAAWASLPPGRSPIERAHPAEPARVVAWVQRACDAKVQAGCTELARAAEIGWLGYPDARRSGRLLWDACHATDPDACLAYAVGNKDEADLRAAADDGNVVAARALAGRHPEVAAEIDLDACVRGSLGACFDLAALAGGALSDEASAVVSGACAEGDPQACALVALLGAAAGSTPVPDAIARLDAICATSTRACEEAAFLRQGAPPVAGYPEPPPLPRDLARQLHDQLPRLHDCAVLAALDDGSAEGWVDAVLRVGTNGEVQGVAFDHEISKPWATCAVPALMGVRVGQPGDYARRAEYPIPVFHGATVKLGLASIEGGSDAAAVAKDTPEWAVPLDACALHGGIEQGDTVTVEFRAHRDGTLSDVHRVGGLDDPRVVPCIVRYLEGFRGKSKVTIPTTMTAKVTLLQPRVPERAEEAPSDFELLPTSDDGPPVVVQMLVLEVRKSRVDGTPAHLGARSIASIEETQRAFADAVERMTHGRLRVELTFREVDGGRLVQQSDDESGIRQYELDPGDLPLEIVRAIEPGRWDSVFVWSAIPRGYPQEALGVSYGADTLRGALISTGAVGTNRAVYSNLGQPQWEIAIHEWWHQVEYRAEDLLGTEGWPPSNHEALATDEATLEPRSWLTEKSVLPWYEHVLGSMPRAFWVDAWTTGTRAPADPDGLGAGAIPVASDDIFPWDLTDGWLDHGAYGVARAEDDATTASFGLTWDTLQPVRTFQAWPASRASWAEVAVEVLRTENGAWVAADAERSWDGSAWTFTLDGTPIPGVRVAVRAGDGRLACKELAARTTAP